MIRLEVAVTPPYPVLVGSGLLGQVQELITEAAVAVLSDSHVAPLHARAVCQRLRAAGKQALLIEVPAGESSKSLELLGEVLRQLAQAGFRRDCAVLAVGGGVVTDLAGFAAAIYLRGVAYYACPTSLLAMVDASVGGKTGINLPEGKNLVGAFWQPRTVIADVATLASLPERQFREGAVELYKHGLLGEEPLLRALDDPAFRADGEPAALQEYVSRSVQLKARVVAADERESGGRAILNLGHTLAHALEAVSEHRLSHGEAVAYGLHFAALLGKERGWHDYLPETGRLLAWLAPAPLPALEFDELKPYLLRDKKNSGLRQRFVLLDSTGVATLVDDVGEAEQRLAWQRLLEVTK